MLISVSFMIMFLIMLLPIVERTNWNNIKSIVVSIFAMCGLGIIMLGSLYLLRFGI